MRNTEEELKDRIRARLGAGRRLLEFQDGEASGEYDHLHEAIQQALDLFNTYLFRVDYLYRTDVATENYLVKFGADATDPDEEDEELLRVVKVNFTKPAEYTSSVDDPFSLTSRMLGGGGGFGLGSRRGNRMDAAGRVGYGDILMWKTQKEAAGRVMSKEPDWLWDEQRRWLAIYCPLGPWNLTIEKAYPHTIASLPHTHITLFLKAAEGYARLILADIRGKFGSQIPGPTGGAETDAQTQRDRGDSLVKEVEESLKSLPPAAPVEFG